MTPSRPRLFISAACVLLLLAAGCASRKAASPGAGGESALPRGDGATLHYRCADGVRVDVQPLGSRVPDVRGDDGPVEVRVGETRAVMRPVPAASGVRYASAKLGWEWFGKGDEAVLRDASTSMLLARDCRLMRAGTAN